MEEQHETLWGDLWNEARRPAPAVLVEAPLPEKLPEDPEARLRWTDPNPMVRQLGPGPLGARCKGCAHLHKLIYAKVYYKCDRRPMTHGAQTDHRANWRACAGYEPGTIQVHDARQ
jgi:hypothetical protein